jgi:hypothetical protein
MLISGLRTWKGLAGSVAAIVLSITYQTANAISPVPTPPCPTNLSSESAEQLANRIADPTKEDWWRACAADSLAQRGADAIPTLIHLLQSRDVSTQLLAIDHLDEAKKHGGSVRDAVPLIVQHLKNYDLDNAYIRDQIFRVYWARPASRCRLRTHYEGSDPPPVPRYPICLADSRTQARRANEKMIDVLALLAIDPNSVETLKRILAEAHAQPFLRYCRPTCSRQSIASDPRSRLAKSHRHFVRSSLPAVVY